MDKTKYLVVKSRVKFKILVDNYLVNQVEQFKYLRLTITSNGVDQTEINTKIEHSERVIRCLNSVWWDK